MPVDDDEDGPSEISSTVHGVPRGQSHLLILGHASGLAWVLSHAKMAFNDGRLNQARKLRPDDRLLLYASKRVFGGPGAKRGLIIGEANVKREVHELGRPVSVAGLPYRHIVDISLECLTPFGDGVDLSAHLEDLELFPDPRNWTSRIRRTVVSLSDQDAEFLTRKLGLVAVDPVDVLRQYQEATALDAKRSRRPAPKQAPTFDIATDKSFLLDLLT